MIGLNISSGVNSVVTANSIIPFIIVPQLLFSGVMIPFDRLNNLFENPAYVPVIGELMPSRWAYEALAVHQFKGNKFTREYFKLEQARNNDIYEAFLSREVEAIMGEVQAGISRGGDPGAYDADLTLIRNELSGLCDLGVVASFGRLEDFTPASFSKDLYVTATDSLKKAIGRFELRQKDLTRQIDALSASLIKQWGGKEAYLEMEERYTNNRLEDLLLNKGQFIVRWNNRFVRKSSPIYQVPDSKFARAHLFAPVKRLGPLHVDTYWFNLLLIWFSGVLLYLALYYDLLRRFLTWNRIRRLRKGN
jgi:hypothetical protein